MAVRFFVSLDNLILFGLNGKESMSSQFTRVDRHNFPIYFNRNAPVLNIGMNTEDWF